MKRVHMVMQGKGGVGKTLVSSLLTQYYKSKDIKVMCFDTDPVNATFFGYKSFNVELIELTENNKIIPRNFDNLIDKISISDSSEIIIDNGASTFLPLLDYLLDNHIPEIFNEIGETQLCCHSIITGSQGMLDTLNGLNELISNFVRTGNKLTNVKFYVWLNSYFGPIEYDGKNFFDMKIYLNNVENISQVFELPNLEASTYGYDYSEILKAKITFYEAYNDTKRSIVVRQRLKNLEKRLFDLLNNGELKC